MTRPQQVQHGGAFEIGVRVVVDVVGRVEPRPRERPDQVLVVDVLQVVAAGADRGRTGAGPVPCDSSVQSIIRNVAKLSFNQISDRPAQVTSSPNQWWASSCEMVASAFQLVECSVELGRSEVERRLEPSLRVRARAQDAHVVAGDGGVLHRADRVVGHRHLVVLRPRVRVVEQAREELDHARRVGERRSHPAPSRPRGTQYASGTPLLVGGSSPRSKSPT